MSEWMKSRLIVILWPSFLMAGIAEVVFFTFIDPQQLYLLGRPVNFSLTATYSIGFIAFWLLCAASSAATLFFMRSSAEINPQPD
ncbi:MULTISPECIES: hypothetical protein [unclassified Uliginosibacterium]|uniref:hypothetical protein n=1 Tax=unclassified Uliginosibacterium TaxID=2621521 RepID=UPI0020B14274|nr:MULTISPECIES: hypothetical protein [unclassified Uliginosibacterium]MDO6384712.1 hypothetical protein [Uliginosibacterium sp. 31-12]